MGRFEPRGIRDSKSAEKYSSGADWRDTVGGNVVSDFQRRVLLCASLRRCRQFVACRFRCGGNLRRGGRGQVDHLGHGGIGTRNAEFLFAQRCPSSVCHGARRVIFPVPGIVHQKFRTPSGALVFQGTLAGLMALTGTFEELTSLFVFAAWIFYALSIVAMFRLRKIAPDLPRPYRPWGYPVLPALFVAGAIALTLNIWVERPVRSTIGLAMILSGLLFYRSWADRAPASRTE